MSDLKNIEKKADDILLKQSDAASQKLPENATSRMQVEMIPSTEEKKIVPRNQREIFEKLSVWDEADLDMKKALVLSWLIQNESYLKIKNFRQTLELETDSLPYKNLVSLIDEFVVATDVKAAQVTNIGNKIKKRFYNPSTTEINSILNMVSKELGHSII